LIEEHCEKLLAKATKQEDKEKYNRILADAGSMKPE
jgi:hypothetical protein